MKFIQWYNQASESIIRENKYLADMNLIVYKVLNESKDELFNDNRVLKECEVRELNNLVEEYVHSDKPIAYIVGFEIFLENIIFVTPNTLIPRFETEELVLCAESNIKRNYPLGTQITILDVCTGSGVIGLSLYKLLEKEYRIKLILSDISSEALKIAKRNLEYHEVENYQLIESDMLDEIITKNIKCDVFISNPPYIDIKEQVQETVLKYEPHLALFARDNGLFYYYQIIDKIDKVMNESGLILFEIGSTQAHQITEYGKIKLGNLFQAIKDINQKDRILFMEYDAGKHGKSN